MSVKKAIAAPFHKGVNFTSWLEFTNTENVDENFFTKKDFENVKSLGGDVIRLPIHFENFCEKENGYLIPEKIIYILDRVTTWAKETEIYVILDFHNNTHMDSVTPADIQSVLLPVWTQLADRYKDASEYVIYELMNEPHGIAIEEWNKIIEKVHQTVREIDPNHYIIVGGADWNSFRGMCALPEFNDDKVIYTFHFYDPHTFTHQGAPWCHMERVVGIPFPYDENRMPPMPENPTEKERQCFEEYPKQGTMDSVVRFFDEYVEFSRKRNAPVYCGEYGAFAPFMNPDERANWYRLVVGLLEERNISRTCWDYYNSFGLFQWEKSRKIWGPEKQIPVFPDDLDVEIVEAQGFSVNSATGGANGDGE